VKYACHLVNRLPSAAIGGKTPMEVWSGEPVSDYDVLRVWGCSAYYHVTESKLDPRAKKAVFVGFPGGIRGYRLWCPESRKLLISRDVTFDESGMLQQKENIEPDTPQQVEDEEEQTEKVEMETPLVPTRTVQTVDCPEDEPDEQDMGTEVEAPTPEILKNKSLLQLVDRKGISGYQLDIQTWWHTHFQLQTMMFQKPTEKQRRVQTVPNGRRRWMRRWDLSPRIRLGIWCNFQRASKMKSSILYKTTCFWHKLPDFTDYEMA
jgi:hypothetical protein